MKLHELIQMAKDGKEFKATHPGRCTFSAVEMLNMDHWYQEDVLADWEIRKEPRVIYVNEYPEGLNPSWNFEPTRGASYKIKTVKFVEVCE